MQMDAQPVVAQETGWSKFIPAGNGLFQFTDLKSASDAIKIIMADYTYHSNVARELANEYFDSKKVLSKMLEQIN